MWVLILAIVWAQGVEDDDGLDDGLERLEQVVDERGRSLEALGQSTQRLVELLAAQEGVELADSDSDGDKELDVNEVAVDAADGAEHAQYQLDTAREG